MYIDLNRIDNKMKIKWRLACFKGANRQNQMYFHESIAAISTVDKRGIEARWTFREHIGGRSQECGRGCLLKGYEIGIKLKFSEVKNQDPELVIRKTKRIESLST